MKNKRDSIFEIGTFFFVCKILSNEIVTANKNPKYKKKKNVGSSVIYKEYMCGSLKFD